jgi:hypothetical protein
MKIVNNEENTSHRSWRGCQGRSDLRRALPMFDASGRTRVLAYWGFTFLLLLGIILGGCRVTPSPTPVDVPASVTPSAPVSITSAPPSTLTPTLPPSPTSVTPTPTESAPAAPTVTASPSGPVSEHDGFPDAPLPLDAYPRPPGDNGMGVHWSTYLYAQSPEATSYFVSELVRMNIKWVKLLNEGTSGRHYDATIEDLVSRDIMPVLRIYQKCNEAYDPQELEALVQHYVPKGVTYYELYNEPNQAGIPGGWCQPGGVPEPEYLAQVWADAARTIYLAGGYPSLPSFFAPSQKREGWQDDFFYRFFEALVAQGNREVLYFSWAPIHNYFINHPPTYPLDDVNLTDCPLTAAEIARYELTPEEVAEINHQRAVAREPGGYFLGDNLYDDSTCFQHFIAYHDQFYDLFGFEIPLISTEGGATKGSGEDPRYPVVDGETVAEWTLWSADYMLDEAPPYYFATMTWLLAQRALEYDEPNWEINAWYHDRVGDQEPVVDALKNRPRLREAR